MTRLAAEGITCRYGRRTILRDVSLAVSAGEVVGVIGPNGAGKTTIVRALAGTLPLTDGRVLLDGQPLGRLTRRQVAQQIAVLPQDPVASFPFTALEVVLMGRTPHLPALALPRPRDVAIAAEAMAALDVGDLAARHLDELSGGERQRILLARALAQQPQILLLDEPTSHLDLRHQVEMYDHLRARTRADGLGVLSVLHDLNLAALYCDRLVLLLDGEVVADDVPRAVLREELLARAFGTAVHVGQHDRTGDPIVLPIPGRGRLTDDP